jgi:hypothetical protein
LPRCRWRKRLEEAPAASRGSYPIAPPSGFAQKAAGALLKREGEGGGPAHAGDENGLCDRPRPVAMKPGNRKPAITDSPGDLERVPSGGLLTARTPQSGCAVLLRLRLPHRRCRTRNQCRLRDAAFCSSSLSPELPGGTRSTMPLLIKAPKALISFPSLYLFPGSLLSFSAPLREIVLLHLCSRHASPGCERRGPARGNSIPAAARASVRTRQWSASEVSIYAGDTAPMTAWADDCVLPARDTQPLE